MDESTADSASLTAAENKEIAAQRARRVRAAVDYLVQHGSSSKSNVIEHARAAAPPALPWELENMSDGTPRWENQLNWGTTDARIAGLIVKDGYGVWSATPDAGGVLQAFSDPQAFTGEVNRRFREEVERRKHTGRKAWLIRGTSVLGTNLVPSWLEVGFVSLSASQLTEAPQCTSLAELRQQIQTAYGHLKWQQRKDMDDELVGFVMWMKVGDVVLTNHNDVVYIGDVVGDWSWEPTPGGRSNLRRRVEWRNLDTPIGFAELPQPLPARFQTAKILVDLTEDIDLIDSLTDLSVGAEDVATEPSDRTIAVARHTALAPPTSDLARQLFVAEGWLAEVVELLNERRQLILYGPPGTSKTWIAQAIADHYAPRSEGRTRLVQFHPSYTYEDFFEGFRPTTGTSTEAGGTLTFELRAGPLRKIVTQAEQHPELAHFLIIDEINRANLAKVFGELYFLLEYRDRGVELLYSDEANFVLPTNVYLIGTMNTADRSIALVDAAMRRRFAFVALHPSEEPTASLLRAWLRDQSLPPTAALLLDELNAAIEDPDFRIGPAYFMKSTDHSEAALSRVWRTSILPLLEEHYYGTWESQKPRFEFGRLMARAVPAPAADANAVDATADASELEPRAVDAAAD